MHPNKMLQLSKTLRAFDCLSLSFVLPRLEWTPTIFVTCVFLIFLKCLVVRFWVKVRGYIRVSLGVRVWGSWRFYDTLSVLSYGGLWGWGSCRVMGGPERKSRDNFQSFWRIPFKNLAVLNTVLWREKAWWCWIQSRSWFHYVNGLGPRVVYSTSLTFIF